MKKIFIIFLFLLSFSLNNAQTNNVLMEYWTGTWCQWCPCGHTIINTILFNKPNTLVLGYHGGGSDPWINFNGNSIISILNYSSVSYPGGVVGRRTGPIQRTSWSGQVNAQSVNFPPPITLSFTKSWNPSTRQLTIDATATSLRQIDTSTKISFVLTESNLVYPQTGNSDCPGGTNYIHKYVVRTMINGATGETFSTGTWANNTVKTKSITTTVDASWNEANLEIGVFVYFNNTTVSGDFGLYNFVLQTAKSGILTNVSNNNEIVKHFSLSQNYPNPFNPITNIKFSIPKECNVALKFYDAVGKEIDSYINGVVKAGEYNAAFDGTKYPSGIYFYKLIAGDFSDTKKMVLIK